MPNSDNLSSASVQSKPDYTTLVRFLLEPLLDNPDSLSLDCEQLSSSDKVWVRVAFEQEDKGKVFGRGGRNLKAIETILSSCAVDAHQQIYLEIYGGSDAPNTRDRERPGRFSRDKGTENRRSRTSSSRRPRSRKPAPQLKASDEDL